MNHAAVLYQVVAGDTVLSICKEHGINYTQFVQLNPNFGIMGHRDPGVIYIGEMFVVGHITADPIKLVKES